jgi:hypothetical protein
VMEKVARFDSSTKVNTQTFISLNLQCCAACR